VLTTIRRGSHADPNLFGCLLMNHPNGAHHIVIIGRRANGIVLATRLGHKLGRNGKAMVTFVDQSLSNFWRPFLHEVAASAFNVCAQDAARAMPTEVQPFQLRFGRVDDVDRVKKEITLAPVADEQGYEIIPARRLEYDTLILESPPQKSIRSCAPIAVGAISKNCEYGTGYWLDFGDHTPSNSVGRQVQM
jgi:hypothetical protein